MSDFEGFEDGDTAEWTYLGGYIAYDHFYATTNAINGSYAGHYENRSEGFIEDAFDFTNSLSQEVPFLVVPDDVAVGANNGDSIGLEYRYTTDDYDDTGAVTFRDDGYIYWTDPGGVQTQLQTFTEGTQYKIGLTPSSDGNHTVTIDGTSYSVSGAAQGSIHGVNLQSDAGSNTVIARFDDIGILEPPAAPTNAAQSIVGDDEIDVTWDADTSGGPIDNYRLQVSEDGGGYTAVATPTTTSYTYAADPATDTHRFRVRAENAEGSSSFDYTTTKETDIPDLSVVQGATNTEADLTWSDVDDESGYDVLLAESSGSTRSDYSVNESLSAGVTSTTTTGLEHGERYFWRVTAVYPGTDSLSNEQALTTPLPSPTLDSLDASTQREITLNYSLPDNSSDGDVLVERSTDGGSTWSEVATVTDLTATSYTDTGLLDGEQYTYRLTRRTDHVQQQTGALTATTILPAPTSLSSPAHDATSFDLSWTANHNNGTTTVQYRPSGTSTWQNASTGLSRTTESDTVSGLRNGEQYDSRVLAVTEHTQTEDA